MTPDTPEDCVFCRIIRGDLPCEKVFENEDFLAFLDLRPVNPGHTLVIPKQHYPDYLSMPPELLCAFAEPVQRVAAAVMDVTESDGWNLLQNNGAAAKQVVFHVHFHVIPRNWADDGLKKSPREELTREETKDLGKRLRAALE